MEGKYLKKIQRFSTILTHLKCSPIVLGSPVKTTKYQ